MQDDNCEEIEKFLKDERVGWINCERVFAVDLYKHVEFFLNSPDYFIPEIKKECDKFKYERRQAADKWLENLGPDDHPCWHSFECHWDGEEFDLNTKLLKIAYDNGWGRIGTYFNKGVKMIEIETTEATKPYLIQLAEDIAVILDRKLVWKII